MRYTYWTGEQPYEVQVQRGPDGWLVTPDGAAGALTARPLGAGQWLLRADGRQVRAWVAAVGDDRFIFVEGHALRLRVLDPDADTDEGAAAGGPNIVAVMPGKVVKILKQPGAEVTAGEPVLVMESMKMETELAAPMDGRIAVVHVAEGQTVAQNEPLIDVEPAAEAR